MRGEKRQRSQEPGAVTRILIWPAGPNLLEENCSPQIKFTDQNGWSREGRAY